MDAAPCSDFFDDRGDLAHADQKDQLLVLVIRTRSRKHVLGDSSQGFCRCEHNEITFLNTEIQIQAFQLPWLPSAMTAAVSLLTHF